MLRLCIFLVAALTAAETVRVLPPDDAVSVGLAIRAPPSFSQVADLTFYSILKSAAESSQSAPLVYGCHNDTELCVWEPSINRGHRVENIKTIVGDRIWVNIAIKNDPRFEGKDSAVLNAFYNRVDDESVLYCSSDEKSDGGGIQCNTGCINKTMNLTTVYLEEPLGNEASINFIHR